MGKAVLLVCVVVLLVLALTGVAYAWTPQDIYNDYKDNGRLDRTYTDAELQAYLNDATLHQYGTPSVIAGLDQLVNGKLSRSEFPFTGAELGLMAGAAVVLIGGGVALRLLTRKRA
jgi:hypothetical protein